MYQDLRHPSGQVRVPLLTFPHTAIPIYRPARKYHHIIIWLLSSYYLILISRPARRYHDIIWLLSSYKSYFDIPSCKKISSYYLIPISRSARRYLHIILFQLMSFLITHSLDILWELYRSVHELETRHIL